MAARKTKKDRASASEEAVALHVPLSVPLTELQRYKLEALELRVSTVLEPIKHQLAAKYNELMQQEFARVKAADARIIEACRARDAYVNEVLDSAEQQAPDGYAAILVSHETGQVEMSYNPAQRGKRLPV